MHLEELSLSKTWQCDISDDSLFIWQHAPVSWFTILILEDSISLMRTDRMMWTAASFCMKSYWLWKETGAKWLNQFLKERYESNVSILSEGSHEIKNWN